MKILNPQLQGSSQVPGVPPTARWIDAYLQGRDKAIQTHATALQGQIGFDNLNQELKELEVKHALPIEVTPQKLRGKPLGAILIHWTIDEDVVLWPRVISERTIRLTFFRGACSQELFGVTVILFGA